MAVFLGRIFLGIFTIFTRIAVIRRQIVLKLWLFFQILTTFLDIVSAGYLKKVKAHSLSCFFAISNVQHVWHTFSN